MENGIFVRKGLTLTFHSVRKFYILVTGHPFVLGILSFIFILYRLFPSLFHFLLSSSPILVCTAILLGTILSFGDQNYIPEFEVEEEEKKVEKEEKKKSENTHNENSSLVAGEIVRKNILTEKDESFLVETHVENILKTDEVAIEDESEWVFIATEGEKLVGDGTVLTEEEPKEIHDKKQDFQEDKELLNPGLTEKRASNEKKLLLGGLSVACENDNVQTSEGRNKKIENLEVVGSFDDSKDSPLSNELEQSDRVSDSSTNQGESSSSDPFTEDLTTMLEELQPLLDAQPTQPALIPVSDSDDESEQTLETTDSSTDSEEEVEWKLVGRGGGRSVLVTWTKEDEENFMRDLLNSDRESERLSRIQHVAGLVEQESDSSDEAELVEIDQRKKIDIYSEVGRSISRLQAIQSRNMTDIDSDFRQFNEEEVEQYSYLELINDVSQLEETRVGLAEFKLPKSIDLAFRQSHDGRVEKPVVLESICENSVFKETKFVLSDRDEVERPRKSINMGPNMEDTIIESNELWLSNEDHVILELPGLETRSPELYVGGHDKTSFADSVDDKPRALECEYPVDSQSNLQVLEESSIGEIYLAHEEHSKGSMENIPKLISESEHGVDETLLAPKKQLEGGMENICRPSESEHEVEEIYLAPKERSEGSMAYISKSSGSEHGVDEIYLASEEHSEGNMENTPKTSEAEDGVDEIYLGSKEHSECSMETVPKQSESEQGVGEDEIHLASKEHSEGTIVNMLKPLESEHGEDELHMATKEHSEVSIENIPEASKYEILAKEILAKEVKELESGLRKLRELGQAWMNQTPNSV